MTERHCAYIVILDKDVRDDAAGPIVNALRMVKGVGSVEPVIASYKTDDQVIARRAKDDTRALLLDLARSLDAPHGGQR